MRAREISHERWQYFFNDFSRLHQGEHVNVETMGKDRGRAKSKLCDLPLVGIVEAGRKAGSNEWIEVIAGDAADRQRTLAVAHPSRVVIGEEHGHAVALQIESSDGSITMVRFEPPCEGMPAGFTVA